MVNSYIFIMARGVYMNNREVKLNIGCGKDKKEGFVNLDASDLVDDDVVHDLNVFPYPFEDNSVDYIEAHHILEHLDKPFNVMRELHRILKHDGVLSIKVPHFSRGMNHAEHAHGFDVTFPLYFNKQFTKSGYIGIDFDTTNTELRWLAFFHLYKYVGIGKISKGILCILNKFISFFANLSPMFCSRIWCFWVGGFDEIEFGFICKK